MPDEPDFLDAGGMPPGALYSERYPMAMAYAAVRHAAQVRKGDAGLPYIAHPVAVSVLVWQHADRTPFASDDPEDLAIAGLLHDVAEDAGGEAALREVRGMFGDRVAQIVALASDALPEPGEQKAPWRPRKEAHIARVRRVASGDPDLGLLPDPGAALVIACDKLDNLRATAADLQALGEPAFDRFTGGPDGTRWYYRQMRDALAPALPRRLLASIDPLLVDLERVRA